MRENLLAVIPLRKPLSLQIGRLCIVVDQQGIRRLRSMPALAIDPHFVCSEPFCKNMLTGSIL